MCGLGNDRYSSLSIVINRFRPFAVTSHRYRPHATASRQAFPVIPSISSLLHYIRPKPLWIGAKCSCPSSGLLLVLHCALPFPCSLTWCPCVMGTYFPSSSFPFRRITPSLHCVHSLAGLAVFTSLLLLCSWVDVGRFPSFLLDRTALLLKRAMLAVTVRWHPSLSKPVRKFCDNFLHDCFPGEVTTYFFCRKVSASCILQVPAALFLDFFKNIMPSITNKLVCPPILILSRNLSVSIFYCNYPF